MGTARRGWSAGRCSAGLYQGWDLHPAQLPTRYLATFAFYRAGLDRRRLSGCATTCDRRAGGVLDEPATAYALAGFLARAVDCGAVDAARGRGGRRPAVAELRRLARRGGLALDALPDTELRSRLARCAPQPRWVDLVAAARPFGGRRRALVGARPSAR